MGAHGGLGTLLHPARVWSAGEVLRRPCPVPAAPGVYGWYFKELPYPIDTRGCVALADLTLLYVGIAPKGRVDHRVVAGWSFSWSFHRP
jgi:hypothetical protein